ncbi:MAG TPA: hypothetical protein VFY68_18365, partial [Nitrososphaeraceae archaeon]|nr:hypothetical protein [Nitrososphaeraceae archaeon]
NPALLFPDENFFSNIVEVDMYKLTIPNFILCHPNSSPFSEGFLSNPWAYDTCNNNCLNPDIRIQINFYPNPDGPAP